MVRRTRQEALATRDRIIDAAESVFHDRAFAPASPEEVAAEAKVTRGAIYHHFQDKAELFEAMMHRVMLPAEDMGSRAGACIRADTLAGLREAAVEVLLRTARDARVRRVMEIAYHKCEYVGDAEGVRERHVASQGECLKQLEAGFRACIAAGEIAKSASDALANLTPLIKHFDHEATPYKARRRPRLGRAAPW